MRNVPFFRKPNIVKRRKTYLIRKGDLGLMTSMIYVSVYSAVARGSSYAFPLLRLQHVWLYLFFSRLQNWKPCYRSYIRSRDSNLIYVVVVVGHVVLTKST